MIKLHLLNWSLKSASRIELLKRAVQTKSLLLPVWGFDPALAIALQLSIEEGLIEVDGNGLGITERGRCLLKDIVKDKDTLKYEKESLKPIGKGLTELMVSTAAKGWD